MSRNYDLGWLSYLLSGTLAMVMSWAFTGCKLGNDETKSDTRLEVQSGVFQTTPTSLSVCRALVGENGSWCGKIEPQSGVELSEVIPGRAGEIMKNPVGLLIPDLQEGFAFFIDPNAEGSVTVNESIPTFIATNGEFEASTGTSLLPVESKRVWRDSSCPYGVYIQNEGSVTMRKVSDESPYFGTARMNLDLRYVFPESECDVALEEMERCYKDPSDCSGASAEEDEANYNTVLNLFLYYVGVGLISADDISELQELGYLISYE